MPDTWKDSVYYQREALAKLLKNPLELLACKCRFAWGSREALNEVLTDEFATIPHGHYLYILDTAGVQISDNIERDGLLPGHFGRDRSERPYMKEAVPAWGYLLSDAYISMKANRPSITALQVIRSGEGMLGYLGADFDLRDLPVRPQLYEEPHHWRQIKGDPAIRGTLFQQTRTESPMDLILDQAIAILEELIVDRGLFQGVIHFSSSRATIWVVDDPFRYRLLDHEALEDPDICLAYPARLYPRDALIPKHHIAPILKEMKQLRMADETIYLRSASINIFNGMVSLTFSCDGTHYMSHQEFLDKDLKFWFGEAT